MSTLEFDASIVIRTRERPELLMRAVKHAAAQDTRRSFEIVVANDRGPDVLSIVERAASGRPFQYANINATSSGDAMNHVLEMARGRVIAYLDDDDILYPWHLRTGLDLMERNGTKAATMGVRALYQDKDGVEREGREYLFPFDPRLETVTSLIPPIGVMHENVGPFWDSSLSVLDDWDAFCKLIHVDKMKFASTMSITSQYYRSALIPSLVDAPPVDFLTAMVEIHDRYRPFWNDGPDAELISAMNDQALIWQRGLDPVLGEDRASPDAYPKFIANLASKFYELTVPQSSLTVAR